MSTRSASVAQNHESIRCRARGSRRSAAFCGHRPCRTGVNGSSASTGSSNVGRSASSPGGSSSVSTG
eukprot:3573021-Pleurochrysis_carterae.AAC.1